MTEPNTQHPTPDTQHLPVMLEAVVEALSPRPGGLYLDATVGLGGHAGAVLEALPPAGRLLGLDQDAEALEIARERLQRVAERHEWTVPEPFRLEQANFADVASILDRDPDPNPKSKIQN